MGRLRFIAGILILVFLIYASNRESSNYERNKKPKENLRQASSVVKMWSPGVSASHIPFSQPAIAESLLLETIKSAADESVKQEARQVQDKLNAIPHFVRFANEIKQFSGEFEHLRAVVDSVSLPEKWEELEGDREILPQCLVVTAKQHDSHHPGQDEDLLFFDAEMVNALGEITATSPAELKTLIILYFFRAEDGEYRFSHDVDRSNGSNPFGRFSMPAYSHECRALVIDLPTESVVEVRRFTEADPAERIVVLLGKGKQSKDGYALLREQVLQWLHKKSLSIR
jgi:hypothetical protein